MAFRILTLDGGGSKGVYTLGILNELESMLGSNLFHHFHLIFGTSTGSILASLIALGKSCEEIKKLYFKLIPSIMTAFGAAARSRALEKHCKEIFGNATFDEFKTDVGIVAMNYDDAKPLIFKTNSSQAYSRKATFKAGFGCTISDSVQASCAAYPIFDKKVIETANQGKITAVDGGFIANNPILYAITDSIGALQKPIEEIRVLSIGTGNFVEKKINVVTALAKKLRFVQMFERTLEANTTSIEQLIPFLFPAIRYVRVNESFNQPQYGTNMIESDPAKLDTLFRLGRNSFGQFEPDIRNLLK